MSEFIPKKTLGKFMHVTDERINRAGGKTLVYFMGAGFCPFCAAERWVIVEALKNFGSWEGLAEDRSADHDEKYLNVPTLNLARARYSSDYVEFVGRETSDRNFEPLQELGEEDYEILDKFNPDQIIPFLLVDGQFMQVGAAFSPKLIEGMSHEQVREAISGANSEGGRAARQEIANLSALVCKSIGGKSRACENAEIKALAEKV